MKELDFSKSSPESLKRLSDVQRKINKLCRIRKKDFTEEHHEELRGLLNERASALSEALGTIVHSICE